MYVIPRIILLAICNPVPIIILFVDINYLMSISF